MLFNIKFKIGNGQKERHKRMNADSMAEASKAFFISPPFDNCVIISIDPVSKVVKPKKKVDKMYLMKIHNTFDKFLFDRLKELNLSNKDVIDALETNRNSWINYRHEPQKLTLKHINQLASTLQMDWKEVADQAVNAETIK